MYATATYAYPPAPATGAPTVGGQTQQATYATFPQAAGQPQQATYATPPNHPATYATQGAPAAQQQPLSYEGEVPVLQPECEPLPVPARLTKYIEIYVNERYSPRLGFSGKGLILGDRSEFSNVDGTLNFTTLEEAAQAHVSIGWTYSGDWLLVPSSYSALNPVPLTTATNEEGWLYSPDFASYATNPGHVKKGMSHFVRRRKLLRMQVFDERTVCINEMQSCQSCDYRRIEQLSSVLLESLYKALHARYGAKDWKADKIVKLKNLMIQALFAVQHSSYSHTNLVKQLEDFVKAQLPSGSGGRYASLPTPQPQNPDAKRLIEALSVEERAGLVRAAIRKFDRSYHYHCPDPQCGTQCAFALQRCPNAGCDARFSRKWWGEHDASCVYKVIACPLECGRCVVRRMSDLHTATECIMRPVDCPYKYVGCVPPGLICRDVAEHVSLNHAYHLALTTAVIDTNLAAIQALRQEQDALNRRVQAVVQLQTRRSTTVSTYPY